MKRDERERMRATGFPKDPATCVRHRWKVVTNLRTMEPTEPRQEQCWHCGATR